MSITADPPGTPESERLQDQANQLSQRRRSRARRFNIGVKVSYIVLFLLLAFLFSGANFQILGFTFTTIQLDWDFITTYAPFIFKGVWLTILLSVLAIALSIVLAIAGALGRLSKSPPLYALATFYV